MALSELLRLVVLGLLVGGLGRLAMARSRAMPWWQSVPIGIGGVIGGKLLVAEVFGKQHVVIQFIVTVIVAGLLVAGYSLYRRTRRLPG
jgi:uncharacterized membrane protein YeaQ/YmgE (transglycosylase-associated protein family)